MLTIDKLKEYGADVETGLKRCVNNEALYLRLVGSVCDEPGFTKLKESVEAGDLSGAFEAAHALKGVLGNLSLTPVYDKTVEITELLRANTDMDYTKLMNEIFELRDDLRQKCQ